MTSNGISISMAPSLPLRRSLHIGALLVFVIASGCNRPSVVQSDDGTLVLGEFVESASIERGVSVGARTLVIESETGAVTITGNNDTEATLLFTITARADSRDAALSQIDKLVIEESGDETSYTYNVVPDRDELTTINVEGSIPRNASIRLILRNGDVTLTNVEGNIEVQQENGSIVYLGGSESVKLATMNGDVFADFYSLTSGSHVNINVANGDISLGLPAASNVSINARTRAGNVSVHDLLFLEQRLARKGAGAVFKGELGNGSANVILKTSNGSLTFSSVTLSAQPTDSPIIPSPSAQDSSAAETATDDEPVPDASATPPSTEINETSSGVESTGAETIETQIDSTEVNVGDTGESDDLPPASTV